MANIGQAAALLAQARRSMQLIPGLPETERPTSIAEAHAIQDATTAVTGKRVAAFKATNPPSGEPTRGLIYDGTVHPSPASIPASSVPACGVEGEVAFIFQRDLAGRAQPYSRDEVAAAVHALAAIEVVDSRYSDRTKVSNLESLADSVSNGAFVHAAPLTNWQGLELGRLHVRLTVNGETLLDQDGGHPTGDPLGVAVALVNLMRNAGGVRAGQFVTCGTFTGLRFLKPGDVCGVQFDGLGAAQVTFAR
jgi:2-keto-4-pentenoate hydratase